MVALKCLIKLHYGNKATKQGYVYFYIYVEDKCLSFQFLFNVYKVCRVLFAHWNKYADTI